MKTAILLVCTLFLAAPSLVNAQISRRAYGLPAGALVIETQSVNVDRVLVLWMLKPKKNPRDMEDGELYTCPEETRGSYYSGATRLSLFDTRRNRIINTLSIKEDDNDGSDEFYVPYKIHAGSYYHVEGVKEGDEGKPQIMWLKDYNGDGLALEFALFDAEACMGLQTALFGYDEIKDKAIQYPIRLVIENKGKRSVETRYWIDYLFSKEPQSPGSWKYEIDYRGRGGSLDSYEIRYNKSAARFEGKYSYTTEDK